MERLTIDEVIEHCKRHTDRVEGRNSQEILEKAKMDDYGMKEYWEHKQVAKWLEKLKAYEQAEEDGLLIRLPCKVGDVVYVIQSNGKIAKREADMMFLGVLWDEYGKEWFTTQAEAEQALAKMKGV